MKWLRRAAAVPLLVLALICSIGTVRLFTGLSAWTITSQRRWWAYAALAVLGWVLLFFALAATSEALKPRGFGESAMLFLLPMQAFPILLIVSGIIRSNRKPKS